MDRSRCPTFSRRIRPRSRTRAWTSRTYIRSPEIAAVGLSTALTRRGRHRTARGKERLNSTLVAEKQCVGLLSLFFSGDHRFHCGEIQKELGVAVPRPATKRLHQEIPLSGDLPDRLRIFVFMDEPHHLGPIPAVALCRRTAMYGVVDFIPA